MEPIYNLNGCTVAWLRGDFIYDISLKLRAFTRSGAVFTYQGRYIGQLDCGFFRDKSGHAVAFMRGATGGPVPPAPKVSSCPPVPPVPSVAPVPPVPPVPPAPSSSLSNLDWEEFLSE
jgi:hypothetical protein